MAHILTPFFPTHPTPPALAPIAPILPAQATLFCDEPLCVSELLFPPLPSSGDGYFACLQLPCMLLACLAMGHGDLEQASLLYNMRTDRPP